MQLMHVAGSTGFVNSVEVFPATRQDSGKSFLCRRARDSTFGDNESAHGIESLEGEAHLRKGA